jgi:hypothetical protein
MTLAIVGTGLVTPFGSTPSEHVFFLRANVPAPPASPFTTRDGERVDANHCLWIGAAAPIDERLRALGERAARSAMAGVEAWVTAGETRVFLCTSKPRPGLDALATAAVEKHLAASTLAGVRKVNGDAGVFAALREAPGLVSNETRVVVVVAVDSWVTPAALEERVLHPPSDWDFFPPPPSEGAAAMVLMDATQARRQSVKILGTLEGAAVASGAANDDNDEVVDGTAMVAALNQLPDKPRARAAYGPWRVDLLRRDEFQIATARAHERFAADAELRCLEAKVGRLGAASGLANAVYGLAVHAHAATDRLEASQGPCLAWAISPDGVRGAARITAGRP